MGIPARALHPCGDIGVFTNARVHGYAQHWRELVGWKSPVRKRELNLRQYTQCNQSIEVRGEGNCGEATNRGEEGAWVMSSSQAVHEALSIAYLTQEGLVSLLTIWQKLTARK